MNVRRSSRARSILALALVAGLLTGLGAGASVARADDQQLKQERQQLRQTRARIRAQAHRLRVLQRDMNHLATQIARNGSKVLRAGQKIEKLLAHIAVTEGEALRLQGQLDERNREAYIMGPGASVLYLLTATSAADAASRMSFLTEMNRRDEILAARVQHVRERLSRERDDVARMQLLRELAIQQLARDRVELREKMAASRELSAALQERRHQILYEISRIHPFAVCPVAGPHAIADDFGIWVHHPKDEGGNHIHQGNDISAPTGTPIVAPFDGVAVASPNKIGGLAVKVFGDFGYVYNAHLSRYGSLGAVSKGDVVGYVGSTGNAGGPHDHLEWHPGGGSAVDPHGFLLQVC